MPIQGVWSHWQHDMQPSCSSEAFISDSDFSELYAKPEKRAEKGRRNKLEKYKGLRNGRDYLSLIKIVHDPQNLLSQTRKVRLLGKCADSMACDIQYSLNRKNRWKLEPSNLLENLKSGKDIDVVVAETNPSISRRTLLVRAYHVADEDGTVKSRYTKSGLTNIKSLMKSDDTMNEDEDEKTNGEKPALLYCLQKPPPPGQPFYGKFIWKCRHHKCCGGHRKKKVDLPEWEASEMESSVHLEENEAYKPSRDFKFSLGDYINASNSVAVNVRCENIESIKNSKEIGEEELSKGPRPADLLDISRATNADCLFERFFLKTSEWASYNFSEQIGALAKDEKLVVKWLDPSHQRASVDMSAKLGFSECPELFVVFDRLRKGHLGVLINTSIPANGPLSSSMLLCLAKSCSIKDVMEIVLELVMKWKNRYLKSKIRDKASKNDVETKDNHVPKLDTFTKLAQVVSDSDMAKLLRMQANNSEDEPFERISDDEFSAEDDYQGFEKNMVKTVNLKCSVCEKGELEDLFEMDDSWQCVDCARQVILAQIKFKYLPIEAAFVTDPECTPYDVLPAILPLPLFNFYTRVAALEVLRYAEDEIADLLECPQCVKIVKVQRPNEYASCCCSGCGFKWCAECDNEPHWPLTCEQFVDWSDKWIKQFPSGVPLNQFAKQFACQCGCILEVNNVSEETICCTQCNLTIKPYMLVSSKKTGKNSVLPFVKPSVQVIKQKIAEPCAQARLQRFTKPKAKFLKALGSYKGVSSKKTLEVFNTVLFIVEYGLAKIYLTKGGPQGLKSSVMQLLRQLNELIVAAEELASDFEKGLKELESNLEKVTEQFKSANFV